MKRASLVVFVATALFLTGTVGATGTAGAQQDTRLREQEPFQPKGGELAKLSPELAALSRGVDAARNAAAAGAAAEPPAQAGTAQLRAAPLAPITEDGRVVIDAVAEGDVNALIGELQPLGFETTGIWGRMASGYFPVDGLEALAAATNLRFARAAAARNNVGSVTSQGVEALGADTVLADYGVDGSGITVGVLSDSFDCLGGAAADAASGDLPAGINVLRDACPGSDEGRAMMQLVADVAPGAAQAFHTANLGQAAFAQGILDLATIAGSDVIVDDIIYFAEPMFQDGIIAQAVDAVRAGGTAYFSSAGNAGRDSWEGSFEDSGIAGVFGGARHDFDPGPGVDDLQSFVLGPGVTVFVFQWDQPFFSVSGAPGSASDMDMILYLPGGAFIGLGGFSINIGGDAVEVFGVNNSGGPLTVEFGLELFDGPAPGLMKYLFYTNSASTAVAEYATNSSTLFAHMNAAGAEAVGASAYFNTPAFNSGLSTAVINGFSSAGGTPILFDTAGNPTFDLRFKPQIVGPDGGNTTFFGADFEGDGFPNFFGTSASAPHAAGVAALMLDANGTLGPAALNAILESTAVDMDDPSTPGFDSGFDFGTGFGFIDADAAVVGASRDGAKIFVCHKAKNTLSINLTSLGDHLGHGDSIGLCD